MKFRVVINCDNAAFAEDEETRHAEVARILRRIAERVGTLAVSGPAMDLNGNRVGEYTFYA